MRVRALELCGAEKGCLFPVAEGFYLGCGDASPEVRSRISPEVPEASFSSGTIALLNIRATFEETEWWRELSWEVMEERTLRGRKAR